MSTGRARIAIYWAAGCGGCEVAVVNIHEKLLDLDAAFELAFCPCLVDAKRHDVEAMADGELALTFLDGAIRTSENEEMARLLRRKSKLLVAMGACACTGGVPGLANLRGRGDLLELYGPTASSDPASHQAPKTSWPVPGGTLELPEICERVRPVADLVDVDYFLPGCPPESERIAEVLQLVIDGKPLPPKGSVVGAGRASVCDQCARKPKGQTIEELSRAAFARPDDRCLLEQGLACVGPATRDGCGALCPAVGVACAGCYGPPEGVADQGARMAGAISALLEVRSLHGLSEAELRAKVAERLAQVPDWAGTFYKFSLPGSLLGRLKREGR
ncbi:MAG TPA: hypothetical protein VGK67_27735 [Myxococcales bacterium]|jgi:F420-non-reducing hydrogenase small subunit